MGEDKPPSPSPPLPSCLPPRSPHPLSSSSPMVLRAERITPMNASLLARVPGGGGVSGEGGEEGRCGGGRRWVAVACAHQVTRPQHKNMRRRYCGHVWIWDGGGQETAEEWWEMPPRHGGCGGCGPTWYGGCGRRPRRQQLCGQGRQHCARHVMVAGRHTGQQPRHGLVPVPAFVGRQEGGAEARVCAY